MAIDKLNKLTTRSSKHTPDPRKPEPPAVFEDKKEAALYGYRYEPKAIGRQDPFIQGGFKPTGVQTRRMNAKVDPNDPNPDNWPTISRFGVDYIPKFRDPPPEDSVGKQTRKRKAEARRAMTAQNTPEQQQQQTTPAEPDKQAEAPQKAPSQKTPSPAKMQTRSSKQIESNSKQVESETPAVSRESTPGPAAATRGASRRRRGVRRGRGGRGRAISISEESSDTSRSTSPVAPTSSRRGRGGRGRGRERSHTSRLPASSPPAPVPIQARPAYIHHTIYNPTSIAPIPPAVAAAVMASTQQQQPQQQQQQQNAEEKEDAAEEARKQKIANSRNPRRTEAMLNHWERFIASGRIRNPKRSKEELESAKAVTEARKASQGPRTGGRKRKREGFGGINTAPISLNTSSSRVVELPPLQPAGPPPPPPPYPDLQAQPPVVPGAVTTVSQPQHPFIHHTQARPVQPSVSRPTPVRRRQPSPPPVKSPSRQLPPPAPVHAPMTHLPLPPRRHVFPPQPQPSLSRFPPPYPGFGPRPPYESPFTSYESPYSSYESPYEHVPPAMHQYPLPQYQMYPPPHPAYSDYYMHYGRPSLPIPGHRP